MSAVDEIQAAIDNLATLKAASTPGPWLFLRTSGNHWHVVGGGAAVLSIASNDGDNEPERAPNAYLVTLLHRTIDAQLAILKVGSAAYAHYSDDPGRDLSHDKAAMQLARAINGATS